MRVLRILMLLCLAARLAAEALPDLPDPLGRAGMMAAVLKDTDGQEVILAAGGSNFPDKMPWDGGTKVFYKDIFLLKKTDGKWTWRKIGQLPTPNAYAAFAATPQRDGLVIAGGCNAEGHLTDVVVARLDGTCAPFGPKLNEPRAYAGCFTRGDVFNVSGGTTTPKSTAAVETWTFLDMAYRKPKPNWLYRKAPEGLEFDRILPLVGTLDNGTIVWAGGCSLSDNQGQPRRTYHAKIQIFKARKVETGDLPTPLAASAGPGVATRHHLLFVGGDDGSHYGKPPAEHPGQSRQILAIDTDAMVTQVVGTWPHPVATAPLLRLGDDLVTISGEMRPGVRTPACTRWTIPAKLR